MKTSFSAITMAAILALAGTSSFAGSGNDATAVDTAAAKAPVVISAPADAAVSNAAKTAAKDTSFDPQINVRMGNQYLLLSV